MIIDHHTVYTFRLAIGHIILLPTAVNIPQNLVKGNRQSKKFIQRLELSLTVSEPPPLAPVLFIVLVTPTQSFSIVL